MKIRTSVNLFLTLTLVIVVFGALTSTIYYIRSFIEDVFYKNIHYILDSSFSELQRDIESGLTISRNFARQNNLIRWFESYEDDGKDGEDIKAMSARHPQGPARRRRRGPVPARGASAHRRGGAGRLRGPAQGPPAAAAARRPRPGLPRPRGDDDGPIGRRGAVYIKNLKIAIKPAKKSLYFFTGF